MVFAGFVIDFDPHIGVFRKLLLGGMGQRRLQRTKHYIRRHILFTRQRIRQHQDIPTHCILRVIFKVELL
jgi:hypothetical protein